VPSTSPPIFFSHDCLIPYSMHATISNPKLHKLRRDCAQTRLSCRVPGGLIPLIDHYSTCNNRCSRRSRNLDGRDPGLPTGVRTLSSAMVVGGREIGRPGNRVSGVAR